MIERVPRSHEQRLATACELARALLDEATIGEAQPSVDEIVERRGRAAMLLQGSPLPTAVFSASDKRAAFANQAWRTLFRQDDPNSVSIPAAAEAMLEHVFASARRTYLAQVEFPVGTRKGYVSMTLEPRLHLGAVTDVIAVCSDITDETIAATLGVPPGTATCTGGDASGADYFSAAWLAYTGTTQLAGWTEALHPEDIARCTEAWGEAIRLRAPMTIEARLRRADGSYRWHRVTFTNPGPDVRWYGAALDIHELRHIETELSELASRERSARADAELANQLKDRFLAAVSHELRAPLTTMLLWEKVLRDDKVDPGLRAQALDAIHQSAELQSRLVADLLDVSRAISGKLYLDVRTFEVAHVAEDALRAIAPMMGAKGIHLDVHIDATVGLVRGDAVRLRQVFDNLLSNALKFTDPGGSITVTVTRTARSIMVAISDTGRGIAREFLPHLFRAFSQHDDALTRRQGGLGLGLAIARELVTLHGGSLEASSPGPGLGATFTVTLPAAGARRLSTPPSGTRPMALDRVRVLVVDDDPRVRDALSHLLKRAGAIVDTADCAQVGRERIVEHDPAVVVCDIAMPYEDGYEFIRKLRADGNRTPAIALTALVTDNEARLARTAGFDLHLPKPIDFDRLVDGINELIAAR